MSKKQHSYGITKKGEKLFSSILEYHDRERELAEQLEHATAKKEEKKIAKIEVSLRDIRETLADLTFELSREANGLYGGIAVDLAKPEKRIPFVQKWSNLNNHKGVFATTRHGKTRKLAWDHEQLIINGWNTILFDPKGGKNQETLMWTIEAALHAGRASEVEYVSPMFPEMSTSFNPLYPLSNEEISSMVAMLAVPGQNADAMFFSAVALKTVMTILCALEYLEKAVDPFSVLAKEQEEYELNLYILKRVFGGLKIKGYDPINSILYPDMADRLKQAGKMEANTTETEIHSIREAIERIYERRRYDRRFVTFRDLSHYANYEALLALNAAVAATPSPTENTLVRLREKSFPDETPVERDDAIRNGYTEILRARQNASGLLADLLAQEREFFQKISVSLSTLLTQLSTGAIGRMFCETRINPLTPRIFNKEKGRGLILVVQPAPLRYQKISEMVVKVMLRMLESPIGDIGGSGELPGRRIGVLIDEAGEVVYPGIERFANKAGGLGMSLFLYSQSIKDYVAKLGQDVASQLMDNLNTYYIGNVNDDTSQAWASRKVGSVRKEDYMLMASAAGTDDGRMATNIKDEMIAEPADFDQLDVGTFIILHKGKRYLVSLPYKPDPYVPGGVIMPPVLQDKMRQELAERESMILSTMGSIKMVNEDLHNDKSTVLQETVSEYINIEKEAEVENTLS